MPAFDIRLQPDDRVYRASAPVDLYLAAAAAGILLEQPCGGLGTCGRCRVRVVEGDVPPGPVDRERLTPTEIQAGWRLGCRLVVQGPATIAVPQVARSLAGKSFGGPLAARALSRPVIASRESGLGLAVDLGTTSLAAGLIDLTTGDVLASASCLNPQVAFGADVIARIKHVIDHPSGITRLARSVREGLAALVEDLVGQAGTGPDAILAAAVAGNPTMLHAWAGISVAGLGSSPYQGTWGGDAVLRADEVGLPARPGAGVYVFPIVRSHVGGDAVAAAVACELDVAAEPTLLIDLGTNSEVLVTTGSRIAATSAAAGPAFEGVSIRCGMRAAPGAIDVLSLSDAGVVHSHSVGGLPASGLCGSGLIDLIAELCRVGVVDATGYMRKRHQLPPSAVAFEDRLCEVDGQQAFVVAAARDGAARDVLLTARDVREVQLAKGSILAATTLACRHVGLSTGDLREIRVAGAFGNFLRKASVARIGLVPPIDLERISLVGNAAGVGARLALIDSEVRLRARRLVARTEYLDLATHPGYQEAFLAALTLAPAAHYR